MKCATCAEIVFCGDSDRAHADDCRIVFPPVDPKLKTRGPYVVLQNIRTGDRFWSTATTPQREVLCQNKVTYRILGYVDRHEDAQRFLFGRDYSF